VSGRVVGRYEWCAPGVWEIAAEPDIMIRLKRIFPRVAATTRGTVTLTGTVEVARDLEWVTDRWPMHASVEDRRRLRAMAKEHRQAEDMVRRVLAGTQVPPAAGPGWVTPVLPLRDYQRTARDLVWASGGVLIADEFGAGKTLMGLSMLEQPDARPALAVTLTGVMPQQWRDELAKFYPMLTSIEVRTGPIHSLSRNGRVADLIVMNYAKLAKWQHHLKGVVRTVIFDEVHELRGETSDRYKAAVTIAGDAQYRAGLSATPVFNYGGTEIYNIIEALRPGALGSRAEFAREWCGTSMLGPKTRVNKPRALRAHLSAHGLFLRRPLSQLGITVPPALTIEQSVPSDPEVLRKIEGNAIELARLILDQSADPRARWSAAGQFDWMMRQSTGIAKAAFVADVVKLLLQHERRVLLLGWHHACHNVWAERLAEFNPAMYTGSETPKQKFSAIRDFKSGVSRVLVMSLRSGAGLDGLQYLTNTLVFGELDWSPAPHAQAVRRLRRPGQTRTVRAYFCTTDSGSDPVMLETLDMKTMQSRGLIGFDDEDEEDELEPVAAADRYEQIKRVAANYLACVDGSDESSRRTA
jgi:SNF2-related domain